ncbi:MAG: Acyl-CoA:1-acyl-sn-glycerol-3-phosphate acyltransferase [Ktedonobacterales bacterium]|jgi:1-acyl-sn-glycerol-3-phosphate acyltransferase|nr:MAG: Acyl-CoA:1-acyl-sn-glycerol-3-phosphate acyltransferase [Ktedonobacterales bacterium]
MAGAEKLDGKESTLIYYLVRTFARLIIPLLARLRTEGIENIPRTGPVILAVNHIHWSDIPLASLRVPRITHYMAKIELFNKPVLGGLIRFLGAFPVRRGEGDREALRTAERLLAENKCFVIFPEGHRSESGALIQAHPGAGYIAMRTGAPIIAVAITGTKQLFKGRYGPWAPRVTIRYSKPFTVGQTPGMRPRDSMALATDEIMRRIAAMLPPENRGPYADALPIASGSPSAPASASTPAIPAPPPPDTTA